jgi:hypothetical protein
MKAITASIGFPLASLGQEEQPTSLYIRMPRKRWQYSNRSSLKSDWQEPWKEILEVVDLESLPLLRVDFFVLAREEFVRRVFP